MTRRGVLLGPQRHRLRRRAADLLDPARRAADRAAAGLLARARTAEQPRRAPSGSTPSSPDPERPPRVRRGQLDRPAGRAAGTAGRGAAGRVSRDAARPGRRRRRAPASACGGGASATSGELVGYTGLNRDEVEGEPVVEVGWSISPGRWGEGLAHGGRPGGDRLGLRAARASSGSSPSPCSTTCARGG